MDRDPARDHDLVGPGELAVAARLGREVDDHGARPHAGDRLLRDESGRGPAGHERGRDDDVEVLRLLGEHVLLPARGVRRQRLRVAALVLGVRDAEVEREELRAEALDLLLHDGTHVVTPHLRAEPSGGRDRL